MDLNDYYEELFKLYVETFSTLKKNYKENFPKLLRRFDIRFRLAYSLEIEFNDSISYTKTKGTKDAYKELHKLSNFWFAFRDVFLE